MKNKNYYEIQKYFAELNGIKINQKSDADLWFELYYGRLLLRYNKADAKSLHDAFRQTQVKTCHNKIINLVSYSRILFCFFKRVK